MFDEKELFYMMQICPNEPMKVLCRRELKRIQKPDPLEYSISDKPRTRQYDDGRWTEYGIYDVSGMSEKEIYKCLRRMKYERCSCFHDCCGHIFTLAIHPKMMPRKRMSIIHHVGRNL